MKRGDQKQDGIIVPDGKIPSQYKMRISPNPVRKGCERRTHVEIKRYTTHPPQATTLGEA